MSVFFLYIHKDSPLEDTTLNTIAEKIIQFPWVNSTTYTEKNLQLVYTTNKTDLIRIFKERLHNLTFFLQGNIFESARGIEKIDEGRQEYTLENQLILRYREKGISACVGLNGVYNLIVWNPKLHLLEIAGDRLGIFQIFFTSMHNNRFILTNDITTLKSIPGYSLAIDKRGIFDLMYMGTALGMRSVLQGVKRLLPNASYQVANQGLQLLAEFRLPFSRGRWKEPTFKLLQELEYFYLSAIKRQLNAKQKLICMQSGGKDSRLFSYHLKKANIIPYCVTIGEKHHAEVFLAKQVNRVLKLPWSRLAIIPEFNSTYTADYFRLSNFSSRTLIPNQLNIFANLPGEWDYLISTLFGDSLFGEGLKIAKLEEYNDNLKPLENYLKFWRNTYCSEEELRDLFGPVADEFISDYRKDAYKLYCDLAAEPYQRMIAFEIFTSCRFKVGAMLNCLNATCPIRLPCVDNDLMDFLFSLPPFLLYSRHLADLFLIKNTKALAAIPIDQNSRKCKALVYDFRARLNYKIWYINQEIKLSIIRRFNPARATTQAYVQSFSLHDKGFQKIREKTYDFLPGIDGVLDIPTAKNLLGKPIPKHPNHIDAGNSIRTLITAVWAIHTFVGTDA